MGSNFIARDMKVSDLSDVIDIHRNCFSSDISIFSVMEDKLLKGYYKRYILEKESTAVVLVNTDANIVIGYSISTRKPGIQNRYIKANILEFIISILKTIIFSSEMRKAIKHRRNKENRLKSEGYNNLLKNAGIPEPFGIEDIWMALAIHPLYRGGGNATSLIQYYCKRVFETSKATRIRGAVLKSNVASMKLFKKLGWKIYNVSNNQVEILYERPN